MFTKGKEYKKASLERKIELIEIDAYSSLIKYLSGRIDYIDMQKGIDELSKLGLKNKTQLIPYLQTKIKHEAYQCSIGKNKSEINLIKERVNKFKGKY